MGTISDTFDRADDATSLGTASDGGIWTILSPSSLFGITADQAYLPLVSGSPRIPVVNGVAGDVNLVAAMRDSGNTAGDMTIDAQRSSASTTYVSAIFINYDPGTGDCYWLVYSGDGMCQTGYTQGGVPNSWDTGTTPSMIGSYATLRLKVASPGRLTVYANGSSIITTATAMPTISGTWVGIAGCAPGTVASPDLWDNFSAVTPDPPGPWRASPIRRVGCAATILQASNR